MKATTPLQPIQSIPPSGGLESGSLGNIKKQRLMWRLLGVVFVGVVLAAVIIGASRTYSHSANRIDGVANRYPEYAYQNYHECESHDECDTVDYCNGGYECLQCITCAISKDAVDGECPECQSDFCLRTCDVNAACLSTDAYRSLGECVCNSGYVGDGITCTLEGSGTTLVWDDYPGYAASWSGGDPLRLDDQDLISSLDTCKVRCAGDTTCDAVEWRHNDECRLFNYKPNVYKYTLSFWTVSILARTSADAWKSSAGTFPISSDTTPFADSTSNAGSGFSTSLDDLKTTTGSGFTNSFSGSKSKPETSASMEKSYDRGFKWGAAGIGLGVVLTLLGIRVARRKREFIVPSFSES